MVATIQGNQRPLSRTLGHIVATIQVNKAMSKLRGFEAMILHGFYDRRPRSLVAPLDGAPAYKFNGN